MLARDDIDIVDVDNVNTAMLGAIARDGKPLYESKGGIFSRWVSFAKHVYMETKWLRDLAWSAVKEKTSQWE